jgi:uncharacterized membrane protein
MNNVASVAIAALSLLRGGVQIYTRRLSGGRSMGLKDMIPSGKQIRTAKKMAGAAKDAGLIDKLTPSDDGADDESFEGVGDGRRLPIQQSVDVAVPVETAWKLWNKYEDYPKFMHRLESAEKIDPKHVRFTGKIWGISRSWEAKIIEKRTYETIEWMSEEGLDNAGVVTFHKLGPRLTHIELNLDIAPHGPIEKIARGLRFTKRAVRADLHRFKAYAEMNEA